MHVEVTHPVAQHTIPSLLDSKAPAVGSCPSMFVYYFKGCALFTHVLCA
jgi:hypothetical protein